MGSLVWFLVTVAGAAQGATTPPAGVLDGPAELPRAHVKSSLADTPTPGKVRRVRTSDELRRALDDLACGETLELEAGAVFSGRFLVPAKHCDDAHWITVRTSTPDSGLPPEGTRLTPCYTGLASLPGRPTYVCPTPKNVLARIEFPNGGKGPLAFASGANHYRLIGLEITRSASMVAVSNLVTIDPDDTADHIVFDRCWLHGNANAETTRGIALGGSTDVAIVESYFSDFHCIAKSGSCSDAQAISGGLGAKPMGPYKLENNFFEASGEDIIFGGGAATSVPHDIEIRRNHLFRPLTWMRGDPAFVGGPDGNPFIVKNIFELKNGERVLFENNVLENCWGGFSQEGYAVLLTPKSQGHNLCPDCRVLDVTIRNSEIRNVGAGFQLANVKSDFGALAKDGGRYSIHDVLIENLDGERFRGHGTLFEIISAKGMALHDLSISHVTGEASRSLFILGASVDDSKMSNFKFTNNLVGFGRAQILSAGGGPNNCAFKPDAQGTEGVFKSCFSSPEVSGNVVIGGGDRWPTKNTLVKKRSDVGFLAPEGDQSQGYRLPPGHQLKKVSTDEKDVGADLDALATALRDVR